MIAAALPVVPLLKRLLPDARSDALDDSIVLSVFLPHTVKFFARARTSAELFLFSEPVRFHLVADGLRNA